LNWLIYSGLKWRKARKPLDNLDVQTV